MESRQQEVSEFSRALKLLAKELEVPVVALSQLNRGPEMRNDKKPQLSDLRESGSIEQDADVVFLVHRPDFYDKEDRPGEADIIMAKHRNGPTETFHLAFPRRHVQVQGHAAGLQRQSGGVIMFATVAVGRLIRFASRITKHGGSALPGKVVEKIDPGFLSRTLDQLPLGVVLVSGTNGKTTTTRMVASMLSDLGLKVFTNPTGSNFVRGVVSALLTEVNLAGKLDADIAVLELDEAYAVHFVKQVKPRYALLLNVMRDQLDRFGEIDTTAHLLSHVAEATTGTVVLNREDPRIAALRCQSAGRHCGALLRSYGRFEALLPVR